jgi:alpha-tubulin suppressor-like RCC1 family protein
MHPILLNSNISTGGLNSVSLATNSGALIFYTTKDGTVYYLCKDITNHREVNMTPPATLGKCRQVVTGYRSAVALQTDGTVIGWGDDGNTAKTNAEYFMTQLNAVGKKVVKLAAGAYHYLALLNDGSVVTWGNANETAQFSDPNTVWSPVGLIPRPTATEAPYITGYSAYINWEYKQDAASFLGFISSPSTSICVPNPEPIGYRLFRGLTVGCPLHYAENYSSNNPNGAYDTPYIRTSGPYAGTYPRPPFAWSGILNWINDTGAPYDYQFSRATVGDPTSVNYSGPGSSWTKSTAHITMPAGCYNNNCSSPNSIFGTSGKRYIDIAAGRGHSILLTENGNIETWGQNWYYTITGSGNQGTNLGWSRAGSGMPNGFNSGDNAGWGAQYPFPPAPVGDKTASTVKSFKTTSGSVKAVGAGYYTSQVIKSDGSLFAWDRNEWGESTPLRNSEGTLGLPTGSFKQVAGGYHHTAALRENGTVVCWGENNSGECNVPFGLSNCVQVIVGTRYTAALRNDGLLIFWGKVDDFGVGYTPVTNVNAIRTTDLIISIDNPPTSIYPDVVTNIAGLNESLTVNDRALIIPSLYSQGGLKNGELIYEFNGVIGSGFTFNSNVYKSGISNIGPLYASNTMYINFYGTYPYHIVPDFEVALTNYINGDIDPAAATPAGISCAQAINAMAGVLAATKEVLPYSTVYHYNVPALPYYFLFTPGNACNWAEKSSAVSGASYTAEKTRLINQQKNKISLFKNYADKIDISSYPTYTDANPYSKFTSESTKQWIYNGLSGAAQELANVKRTTSFNSFVAYAELEGGITTGASGFNQLINFPSTVSFDQHMGLFLFKGGVIDASCTSMFIWFPLKYYINLAASNLSGTWTADKDILTARRMLNDIFLETQTVVYTIASPYQQIYDLNLYNTNGSTGWNTTTAKNAGLCAGAKKVINLARLFKNWSGFYGPLQEDCAEVTARMTTATQSLVPYSGTLNYIPRDWNSIVASTDPNIVTLLSQYTSTYTNPSVSDPTTKYTRAYTYGSIPSEYLNSRAATGGALYSCSLYSPDDTTIIRDTYAFAQSDPSVGDYIRAKGHPLAVGYKIIQSRFDRGLTAGSANSTTQATLLTRCTDILTEINTHVPFQRNGWDLYYCSDPILKNGCYLATSWYINGAINMLYDLQNLVSTDLTNKIKDQLKAEVFGLVDNWKNRLAWYTKGQLTGLPTGAGQPNTNQWIEPAASLVNATLYLGDSNLLPAYNLGVSLLAETLNYGNVDGSYFEGWAYAQQSMPELFNTINYMAASGDTRLKNTTLYPFTNNYWNWTVDYVLPGNAILNASDCRTQQLPSYAIDNPLPSFSIGAIASSDSQALPNVKYLYPNVLSTDYGIDYYQATKNITGVLTIPNFKYYPDQQMVIWRSGRDKPIDIQNNIGSSHFALWVKGSSTKEAHNHRDQGQISIYCGNRVILMDCGIDYYEENPILLQPMIKLQEATGHNIMQLDGQPIGGNNVAVNSPITVTTLGATSGDITINTTGAYTKTTSCTRRVLWSKPAGAVSSSPLNVTIIDNVTKTVGITTGTEIYRFHTGLSGTTGISPTGPNLTITGSGTSWVVGWTGTTMGITSNFPITLTQSYFNDFTQLVNGDTSLENPRVHKVLSINAATDIAANTNFSMTTGITVGWSNTGG